MCINYNLRSFCSLISLTKKLIDSNPKCRLFLKIDLKRDMAAGVYLSEAPSPPRFWFGVVKQFCRFRILSNTQCLSPAYALHTTRSPSPNTYCTYSHKEGGEGGGEPVRRLEGCYSQEGRKYQHD